MFRGLRKHQRVIGHWAMEFLVVFVGVLIALSAQAWSEERSAEARAEAAEIRIRGELLVGIYYGVERIALRQCLRQRLVTLAEALAAGRTDWSNMRIADPNGGGRMAFDRLYRMPSRPWVSGEYRGSVANGALDALPAERTAALSDIYEMIETSGGYNAEEQRLAATLAAVQFGTPLSAPERNELLAKLTRLDYLNGAMILIATQNAERFRNLYRLTAEEIEQGRELWPADLARMRSIYGNCVDSQAIGIMDRRLLR